MSEITLNATEFILERIKFKPKNITLSGVYFDAIHLASDAVELIKAAGTRYEMLDIATDYGMSCGRVRIIDNEEMNEEFGVFWGLDRLASEGDAVSIKQQLGLFVCEISGLAEHVQEQKVIEEEVAQLEVDAKAEADAQKDSIHEQMRVDAIENTDI